jgi:hypothetical protein
MSKHIKHKHHIVPKHMGGSDDSDNIVELSIIEHAEAHKKLYEEYNKWQDRVAWLGLSGLISSAEAKYEAIKESMSGSNNPMWGKPAHNRGVKRPGIGGRKKGTKWSDEERKIQEKIRSVDGYYDFLKDPARCSAIGDAHRGRVGHAHGKKWYNNGIEEKYSNVPIDGWMHGRLNITNQGKIGIRWFNNGHVNRQFKDGEQPAGFIYGRLHKK